MIGPPSFARQASTICRAMEIQKLYGSGGASAAVASNCTCNPFEIAWLPDERRATYVAELADYVSTTGAKGTR
jgi:hypothetical protein